MKTKKMPIRKCSGCGEKFEKNHLLRIVKSPDGSTVSIDTTGKSPGRGAYICKNVACLEKAKKARRFEKVFKSKIPSEIYDDLERKLSDDSG